MGGDAGKPIPGYTGGVGAQVLQQPWREGVVEKMDQSGRGLVHRLTQVCQYRAWVGAAVGCVFGRFGAEGAFFPITAPGRCVGQHPQRREIAVQVGGGKVSSGQADGTGSIAAAQGDQALLTRAGDQFVDQPCKGVADVGDGHPGGHQPAAADNRCPGQLPADEADHGEGAQGLAHEIDRHADNARLALFEKRRQVFGENPEEGVEFEVLG